MTELPTTFGKYFLTELLATGGMAEIYLAKLLGPGGFEKPLVIKQIHPRLSGQRQFVDLFVAEAKTLVSLAHGNIVPVYELGVIDDTYFIAMEYIDGPTLYRFTEALARKGARMEPAVAAWIAARILEGLDYAHHKGEGVIHRDLSPRNVMLSRDGEVKLVDFGIAVTLGSVDDGVEAQSAPTGSFPYMSPEQVRREPLTGQTDLFSVGVLMWEMLVGHRLFARPDAEATLAAVTDGEIPRPSAERPEIPAKLDDVVMRALERDQTARWSSAADMLAALQRYLYGLDDTPGPREVAALVARYCPPEKRRMSTHADSVVERGDSILEHAEGAAPPPEGPRTAVLDRADGVPRGKQRARTQTFATHVDLKNLLERATPLLPIPAIVDEPPAEREPTANLGTAPNRDPAGPVSRPPPIKTHPEMPEIGLGRLPPSRALLVFAAIGAMVLGFGALYVFYKGRSAVMRPDAMPKYDAPDYAFEPDAIDPPDAIDLPDAPAPDAPAGLDASPSIDARGEPPHDAGSHPNRPDAGVHPDAAARITGTAKLKIGANPWGEIEIDGVARGRTPKELDVPAGHHVVSIIYRGEDPPLKKTFPVDVLADETRELQADFTK